MKFTRENWPSLEWISLHLLVVMSLIFGGGKTEFGFPFLIQIFVSAILLSCLIIFGRTGPSAHESIGWPAWTVGLSCLFMPLLQLIPLPPSIWSNLPGRTDVTGLRELLGASSGWYPLSLSPIDTALAFGAFMAVGTALVATLRVPERNIRRLLVIIAVFAFLTVVLGAAQVTSGGRLLDFYSSGHRANVIGLFANRNHAAVFVAGCIPIFVHLVYGLRIRPAHRYLISVIGVSLLIIGIFGTTSRAGLLLCVASCAYTLALAVKLPRGAAGRKWTLIGLVGIMLFAGSLAFTDRAILVIERFASTSEDLRWNFWIVSLDAVRAYWPVGSGFGTFVPVYSIFEPIEDVSPQFVNNAHNDYIEVALEAGLVGAALLAALLLGLAIQTFKILKKPENRTITSARAVSLALPWMVAIHSLVDYPARRMAIAVPLAVLVAIMFRSDADTSGKLRSK
jgi:O-antigen ligase